MSRKNTGCTNMDCEDVRQEIELYVLGAADETEGRLIQEHLSRCLDCRQIERQYVLLVANLRRQGQSSGADSELVARILSAMELPLKRARRRKMSSRSTLTAVSIAVLLLLAAFVWQIWWGERNNGVLLSASQVEHPLIPAKTLWHKANAICDRVWQAKAAGCRAVTACDDLSCFLDRTRKGRLIGINRHTGRITWQVPGLHSYDTFVKVGRRWYLKTEDSIVRAFTFGSRGKCYNTYCCGSIALHITEKGERYGNTKANLCGDYLPCSA